MMRRIFTLVFLLATSTLFAQKYSGQWSGSFDETRSPNEATEYVLEIDVNGNTFTGTSTTYFIVYGKRYYTICEIKGTIDPASKTLTSTETKVIKKNTPPEINDCLQTHILTYFKKGEVEELSGNWKGARVEDKCGTGKTTLSRKQLVKNTITTPPPSNTTVRMSPNTKKPTTQKPVVKKPDAKTQPKTTPPVVKTPPKKDTVKASPSITKVDNKIENKQKPELKPTVTEPKLQNGLEKRDNKIYETISIKEAEITVSLYDNAEIDGDIITVLFNGEVVASQKTLSDKPITLKLNAIKGKDNTLTMYAENQGRVPPNTAIMRVQSGDNYFSVFLSADDKKNGSVVFRVKG